MRRTGSLILGLAAMFTLQSSSPAHADANAAKRSAFFRAMRDHIRQAVGSDISQRALASMLNQVDRLQARSKACALELSQPDRRHEALQITARGPKTFESLEMKQVWNYYTTWTLESHRSTSSSLPREREKIYYVDKSGSVSMSDKLTVYDGSTVLSTYEGKGKRFAAPR